MKVHFWGTQGSLPASFTARTIREKVFAALEASRGVSLDTAEAINAFIDTKLPFWVAGSYGSNTPCVQVENLEREYLLFDAGSGLRDFSYSLVKQGRVKEKATFHIILSHLHWDHIQGFPFFAPAFIPGNRIFIHTYHEAAEKAFRQQMRAPCFPVDFDALAADIEFVVRKPCDSFQIGDFQITAIEQNHPGISYGYRLVRDGKILVYSTDSEHKQEAFEKDYRFVDFFRDADLLIFDAQYTMADATFTKANWGHSSNVMGVELAARAKAKRLAIFHHEPTATDKELDDFLLNTRLYANIYHQEAGGTSSGEKYPREILLAYDGLEINL